MRVAGAREFRSKAPELLKRNEVILVTRHGQVAYIVVPTSMRMEDLPDDIRREVGRHLTAEIRRQLDRRGVTEKQIERDFDAWRKKRRAARGGR